MFKPNPPTRRHFLKYLGVSAASAATIGVSDLFLFDHHPLLEQAADAQEKSNSSSSESGRSGKGINVVLVHGALADASTWNRVIPLLQAEGYTTLAVQLPLTSLEEDIAITQQALATISGPIILVAHSYGGSVITAAAADVVNVKALVYAEAFAPAEGESINTLFSQYAKTPLLNHVVPSYRTGYVWCDPSWFPHVFAQDLDPAYARELASAQKPIQPGCFATIAGAPAWEKIPSWYLISADDRCIDPASERFMAKRIGATTREIASSHISPLSRPQVVFELIVDAARKTK